MSNSAFIPMTKNQGNVLLIASGLALFKLSKLVKLSEENNKLVKEQSDLVKRIGDAQLDALNRQILIAEDEVKRKNLERLRKQIIFELKVELDELEKDSGFRKFWISRAITNTLTEASISSQSFSEIPDKQFFSDLLIRLDQLVKKSPSELSDEEVADLGRIEEIQGKVISLAEHLNNIIQLHKVIESRSIQVQEEVRKKKSDIFTFKGSLIFCIICLIVFGVNLPKQGDPPNWAAWIFLVSCLIVVYKIFQGIKRLFKPVDYLPTEEDYANNKEIKSARESIKISGLKIYDSLELHLLNVKHDSKSVLRQQIKQLEDDLMHILRKHEVA